MHVLPSLAQKVVPCPAWPFLSKFERSEIPSLAVRLCYLLGIMVMTESELWRDIMLVLYTLPRRSFASL